MLLKRSTALLSIVFLLTLPSSFFLCSVYNVETNSL